MTNQIKTIFNGLNINDVKKFEEIISNDNVTCTLTNSGIKFKRNCVAIRVNVRVQGLEHSTLFTTNYFVHCSSYQEAIEGFLLWWNKEIVRFNSFIQLTKSNKEKL